MNSDDEAEELRREIERDLLLIDGTPEEQAAAYNQRMYDAINKAERQFADPHEIFTYTCNNSLENPLLEITFRVVVGALSEKEVFLLKCNIIEKYLGIGSDEQYYYKMQPALSNQQFTCTSYYSGQSPTGIQAVNSAYKRWEIERKDMSLDEAYVLQVNLYQRFAQENPSHPLTAWFLRQFSRNQGWATSR